MDHEKSASQNQNADQRPAAPPIRPKPTVTRFTGPAAITAALMNLSPRRPGSNAPPTQARKRPAS